MPHAEAVDAKLFYSCFSLYITEALRGKHFATKHSNSWNPKRAVDLYPQVWLASA